MSDLDILDEEFLRPSVFMDEAKLSADYIPENLLYRKDALKGLASHFRGLFKGHGTNRGIILTGPIGSGKTSIVKKFGQWSLSKGRNISGVNLRYIHVNCRINRTPFMILLQIARELNNHIPSRGYSANELMEIIIEILEAKETRLLLVLDEVDYSTANDLSDLLYSLSRSTDDTGLPNHLISLILISRSLTFVRTLDESTRSSLTTAHMKLEPYSKDQLYDIIEDRIRVSFEHGTVTSESIELAAEIASSKGDARQALELIWYAGKFADQETSSYVYPEHVRKAKANVDPSLLRRVVDGLSRHKMLLLLGIARKLRQTHAAFISTGEAKEAYHIVCEEYLEDPRKHTQVWEYLKDFEKLGIISSELSGEGVRGTTQLISIQDATAEELESAVFKRIR